MGNSKAKSIKNIIYGILGQIITIAFGLIVPRIILVSLGSEANGLTSSISQIFAYVALLEAGVGGATLQALYKPVGAEDRHAVSAILAATDHYYKKTGVIYALAVTLLAFLYPLIVETEFGFWTVFGVILFNGMGGAINFFFQGKYHLLLQAEGKNYIRTNLSTIVYVLSSIVKTVLVYTGFGVVALQVAYFIMNLLQMLYIILYIKRYYKWIDLSVTPDYVSISQKNSVMVHQVSSLIFGNTDSIILTMFCGLKVVSVYSIISSIITHVNSLLNNVSSGILFTLGQSFHNNRSKFNTLYDVFEMVYYGMIAFALAMIYIFLNPFLGLYTSGVTDISYVDSYLPLLFVISYYLTWARVPSTYVINNCAGHFKQTRNRSVLESAINIVISIFAVFRWGIYGVLIGTIAALLYRTNDMIIYSAKHILHRSIWVSYKRLLINTIWLIVAGTVGKLLLPDISSYGQLLLVAIPFAVAIGIGTLLVNFLTGRALMWQAGRMIFRK